MQAVETQELVVRWLGRVRYGDGLTLQEELVAARRANTIPDTLLLLEHDSVITLGRGAHEENLLTTRDELQRDGVEVFESGRGGDITFHGPGQLVGYPILALAGKQRDAHAYLRSLEAALIHAVADFGIDAGRVEGLTGVWVGDAKLAAMGVRLSTGWITSHGFAVNVGRDLSGFDAIVPCGIKGRGVTSIALQIDREPALRDVASRCAFHVAQVFGRSPVHPAAHAERLAWDADTAVS